MSALLSRAFSPALRRIECNGIYFIRMISAPSKPSPAVHVVEDNRGFLRYQRDVSRNPNAKNPQKLGDTPYSFLTRRLGHAFEVYPLFVIVGFWFCILCYATYTSAGKIEVWWDRSKKDAPWSWERIRNNYWKHHTLIFDPQGVTHRRLEIMERLQDEMLEASKKRAAH